jgi:hypothetical protein
MVCWDDAVVHEPPLRKTVPHHPMGEKATQRQESVTSLLGVEFSLGNHVIWGGCGIRHEPANVVKVMAEVEGTSRLVLCESE